MTEIGFYHLTMTPLEKALPRLLEKVLAAHKRAVILCASQERLSYLDSSLWTGGKLSFLPHGSEKEGFAEDQPIWLTLKDENPNGAHFLVMTDGAESTQVPKYERCLDLFDGNDEEAVNAARGRWKKAQAEGHSVTYWKQSESGTWVKGATS